MAGLRGTILGCMAVPLVAVTAAAQNYRAWDRNGDGVVTRSEWRGTVQEFRDRDRNRDGVLSGNELRDVDRTSSRGSTGFDAMDNDNDGRIERDEWTGSRLAFNRLDANGDGVLSRRELASNDAVVAGVDDVANRNEGRVEDSVVVDAREPWTPTSIYVNAGDLVSYRAEGTIQMTTGADDRATPAGALSGRNATNAPRPDLKAGTLLVRVGNGPVEAFGANGTFTARQSGRVYLGVNDDHFPDNSGGYRAWLSVRSR